MNNVKVVYKPIGKTPLEMITALKQHYPEFTNKKITYAGRLDPMAHGLLILLIEPETKKSHEYRDLSKEYECEAVFGISTDTYDALGIPHPTKASTTLDSVQTLLIHSIGKQIQQYPPYSSAPIRGKPLFQWAREGKLHEIEIPSKQIEVFDITILDSQIISSKDLLSSILSRVALVNGDFRQSEISSTWERILTKSTDTFLTVKLEVSCSSGTYIRGLVHELGNRLECGAFCLDIKRTKIGTFDSTQVTELG